MYEIIARVARAVACSARLRILSCLARADEMAPSHLASKLGISRDLVSLHLRRLSAAGLIQRRRSGVWCYCRADSPYSRHALSGKVTAWARQALRQPRRTLQQCGIARARPMPLADVEAQLHALIFEAATAFTNIRRLQILHRLAGAGTVDVSRLSRELSMSPSAVSRHTAKLVTRGYLTAARVGRTLAYRLAPEARTPVHGALLRMVREAWEGRELQS